MNRRIIWKSPLGIAIIFHLVVLVLLGYIVHEDAKKEIEFVEVTMEDLLRPQTQTAGPAKPAGGGGSPRRAQVTPQQPAAAPKPQQTTVQAPPAPVGEDASLPVSAGVVTGGFGSGTDTGGGQGGTGDGTGTGNGSGSGSGSGSGNGSGTGHGTIKRPQLVVKSKPPYPAEARRNGWEGTVSLRLRVSEEGDVEGVSISASSGYDCLDKAALREVWNWRFNPARDEYGRTVASGVVVPMRFNLEDA